MSEKHFDPQIAERLLDGGAPTPETVALADLLASAAAPAREHELAGEHRVAMAFRAAYAGREAPRRPQRVRFTVKAIIAALATAMIGGLAFASTTGILPLPFKLDPGSPSIVPATSAGTIGTSGPRPTVTATPNPQSMHGLCNAYLSKKPKSEREKSLKGNAFSRLVAAAGGPGNVEAFCTALAEERPEKAPKPSKKPKPG